MARPCVARRSSKTDERESCNNVLGLSRGAFAPGHHGYPRASRLTSGKTSKGHHGTQPLGCAGQTVRPSLHSISQTSAGKLFSGPLTSELPTLAAPARVTPHGA